PDAFAWVETSESKYPTPQADRQLASLVGSGTKRSLWSFVFLRFGIGRYDWEPRRIFQRFRKGR
ncbi:MAG: hypothetical protein ACRD2L_17525, partial [Terriglobia bacterium]